MQQDKASAIKAICIVHDEAATGATSYIGAVRAATDAAAPGCAAGRYHQLGSVEYRQHDWDVDVTIAGEGAITVLAEIQ